MLPIDFVAQPVVNGTLRAGDLLKTEVSIVSATSDAIPLAESVPVIPMINSVGSLSILEVVE